MKCHPPDDFLIEKARYFDKQNSKFFKCHRRRMGTSKKEEKTCIKINSLKTNGKGSIKK